MFERFTDRGRRVLALAQEDARLLNHNFIGTEHILLGLVHEGEGVAARVLESMGISLEAVIPVPPTAVVDVRHSRRFAVGGSLRGAVAGSTINLTVELPRSASSATGTLDDRPVNVAWRVSYDSRTGCGLPPHSRAFSAASKATFEGCSVMTPTTSSTGPRLRGPSPAQTWPCR